MMIYSSTGRILQAIGKTCLTMLQLQTFLTETEAIINLRALVYLGEDLNDRTALIPFHFLSPNRKTGTPLIKNDDDIEDPTYVPAKISSEETLIDTWIKRAEFNGSILEVKERRLPIESMREITDKSEITTS